MARNERNPINICDKCKECEDRFGSLGNCHEVCGYPLDVLLDVEQSRNMGNEQMTERDKKAIIELQEKYERHFNNGEYEKCKAMIGVFCILNKHLTGQTGWQIKFEGSKWQELENVNAVI